MKNPMHLLAAIATLLVTPPQAEAASAIKTVIVIVMENTNADQIYGNTALAPYINGTLMPIRRARHQFQRSVGAGRAQRAALHPDGGRHQFISRP